jgi:hypothetical protein
MRDVASSRPKTRWPYFSSRVRTSPSPLETLEPLDAQAAQFLEQRTDRPVRRHPLTHLRLERSRDEDLVNTAISTIQEVQRGMTFAAGTPAAGVAAGDLAAAERAVEHGFLVNEFRQAGAERALLG